MNLLMSPDDIVDRYPWVSEEDAKKLAQEADRRAVMLVQEFIYDEATRLKPR